MNYSQTFNGWFGEVGVDFTLHSILSLSESVAEFYSKTSTPGQKLVVAYDNRLNSKQMAEYFASFMATRGIKVFFCNRPTPSSVAVSTSASKKSMGTVVFTGDTKKETYGGIRLFDNRGKILTKDEFVSNDDVKYKLNELSLINWINKSFIEPFDPYISYKQYINKRINFDEIASLNRILFNPFFGSGIDFFDLMFNEKKIHGYSINREKRTDYNNSEPNPAVHEQDFYEIMLNLGTELGFMVSPDCSSFSFYFGPHKLSTFEIIYLLTEHLKKKGKNGYVSISEQLPLTNKIINTFTTELSPVKDDDLLNELYKDNCLFAVDRFNRFYFPNSQSADALTTGFYLVEIFNNINLTPKMLHQKINKLRSVLNANV